MGAIIIAILVVAILFFYVINVSNKIKRSEQSVDNAYAGIEVYLEERFDSLTKILSIANEESKREIEAQTNIAKLRTGLRNAKSTNEKVEATMEIEAEMARIQARIENYPEFKFNDSFKEAQRAVLVIEDKLSAARRNFNNQVRLYNNLIVTFPANMIANNFGFDKKIMFTATESKRGDVDVSSLLS